EDDRFEGVVGRDDTAGVGREVARLPGPLLCAEPEVVVEPGAPDGHHVGPAVGPRRRQPVVVRRSQPLLCERPRQHPLRLARDAVARHVRAPGTRLHHPGTVAESNCGPDGPALAKGGGVKVSFPPLLGPWPQTFAWLWGVPEGGGSRRPPSAWSEPALPVRPATTSAAEGRTTGELTARQGRGEQLDREPLVPGRSTSAGRSRPTGRGRGRAPVAPPSSGRRPAGSRRRRRPGAGPARRRPACRRAT